MMCMARTSKVYYIDHAYKFVKVKGMQRSGTEAIRTHIQPSKPKGK